MNKNYLLYELKVAILDFIEEILKIELKNNTKIELLQ